MSTLTPPPVGTPSDHPEPERPEPEPERRRTASSVVVAVTVIALGALVITGAIATSAFQTVFSTREPAGPIVSGTERLAVAGVDGLRADVSAGSLRIRTGDVAEATLEVTGAPGLDWSFVHEGDTLVVASPRRGFGDGWWWRGTSHAVLTLPETDEEWDADLRLAAGELHADGAFGDLVVDVAAGALSVGGSAHRVDVEVSAGGADLDLADVDTADLRVSAGGIGAHLTGAAPNAVAIDVSAGSLELALPEASYDVTSDTDGGRLVNDLPTRRGAAHTVDVSVSAGSVDLRTR